MGAEIFAALIAVVFGGAAFLDFRTRKVPNWLTIGGFLLLLAVMVVEWPQEALVRVLAAVVFFAIGAALYFMNGGATGGGAVKLLASVGLVLGFVGGAIALALATLGILLETRINRPPEEMRGQGFPPNHGAGLIGIAALLVAFGPSFLPARNQLAKEIPRAELAFHRCMSVPADLANGIVGVGSISGSTLVDGMSVRDWQMVNGQPSQFQDRRDLPEISYVAAEVNGPGHLSGGDVAVWRVMLLSEGGMHIYPMQGPARDATRWGSDDRPSIIFEEYARLAQECVLAMP